ncbi:hypothetical protein V7014_12690 [Bacillus sp. JJ722]
MLKKVVTGISIASVLIAGTVHATSFNGVDHQTSKSSTSIKKIEMDVTGDKNAEIVTLQGNKAKGGFYKCED